MGLATVIRLEFAYPGVGVFAGDSLQYLSIATAHGVIMVFFMIMPTLFGAFGNFLLPTQLGVHDVAFPRLNSAAFWFLPGGLIMLLHLVCIDRRYQRLNCFNIRQLQAMLKQRFFQDLINSNDHRTLINNSMIGLRYKTNSTNLIDTDMKAFYDLGTYFNLRSHNQGVLSNYQPVSTIGAIMETFTLPNFLHPFFSYIKYISNSITFAIYQYTSELIAPMAASNEMILQFLNVLQREEDQLFKELMRYKSFQTKAIQTTTLPDNMWDIVISSVWDVLHKLINIVTLKPMIVTYVNPNTTLAQKSLKGMYDTEVNSSVRFLTYENPFIQYRYKSGNYLGKWTNNHEFLMTSFNEVTITGIKPVWFLDEGFRKRLSDPLTATANFNMFSKNIMNMKHGLETQPFRLTSKITVPVQLENPSNTIRPVYDYFQLSFVTHEDNFISTRWVSMSSLNQKFTSMFTSSSLKYKTLSNWRQLKFSREAWRCKLLVARNQNTFYKRFAEEDTLFFSLDRNAKDLLPGWAMVTPFSARPKYTAVGKTDVGLMAVFLVLNASIVSSVNFLVTYRYLSTLNNRKMRDARSFFAESLIVASWMMVAANPMLVIGIVMLLFDRHWQTSFFDYSGGGDTVLFQHMFWFFGHPEVYVIMIPVFGFTNTILSYYLRKRVSARSSLMYSMYTIAFLGFFVWGHHMYMVGLAHTTRMLFSTLTVMISVPAATKLMHWSVTLVNSYFTMEVPFLWTLTFIYFFVSGGVSGMCVAHTGMDVLFHDTFYVIGHFHVMLAGSGMMGIFSAFYFYFPVIYGVRYSRVYAYIHYVYYIIGQFLTVVPMLWLGYCGMPRRVLDYPSALGGWHAIATAGHLLSVFAMLSFFLMIYDSIRQAKATIRSNFGIGRFNTRLNFYLFEISRVEFIQRKNLQSRRFYTRSSKTQVNNIELSHYDSTLFSYQFQLPTKNS